MGKNDDSSVTLIKSKFTVFQIIIIAAIILLSRLPYISAGYGSDVDAWRVVAVARDMTETGDFVYSRVPGHPLHELICTLFWDKGPLWMNGSTALMSTLASVFFLLVLKKLSFKNIYLPALALAFTPAIFINSVNALEHIWALAFIMGSIYFVMDNKPIAAGIFLGLADGCRLPSILMVIPLAVILYYNSGQNFKGLLKFVLSAGIVTLILFLPLFLKFDLFNIYKASYPGITYIAFRMFLATWGLIGFIAIIIACVIELAGRIKPRRDSASHILKNHRYFDPSLMVGIVLFAVSFLLFPHKAAYLIPAVPMVLILLGRFLKPRLYNIVCVSLVVSPFFMGINRMDLEVLPEFSKYSLKYKTVGGEIVLDFLKGPVLSEHSKRLKQLEYVNRIIFESGLLANKSVVAVGEAFPLIDVTLVQNHRDSVIVNGNVMYEYALDRTKLNYYLENRYDIYYLPGEEVISLSLYGVDLKSAGAKSLFIW